MENVEVQHIEGYIVASVPHPYDSSNDLCGFTAKTGTVHSKAQACLLMMIPAERLIIA